MTDRIIKSSFRDPSGFLFTRDDTLYRQINESFKDDYDLLMNSGLYEELVGGGIIVPHEEVDAAPVQPETAYKIIRPERIAFISYPYEWCFSQLRDAALLTLEIHKKALGKGMSLKDCSAYNIQFAGYSPVFIDTLSFERYKEGAPWVAYRQYCQHFLAPLALMVYKDVRLSQLLRTNIDGVPLDLASSLLPFRTRFRFSLLSHIHMHAKFQKRYGGKEVDISERKMSLFAQRSLVDNLESMTRKLRLKDSETEWGEYYDDTNYTEDAFEIKKRLVGEFLERCGSKTVWDLGANTGIFSRIAADGGRQVVSWDIDPAAVEKNYSDCKEKKDKNILPLILDLSNPSPALGWANEERDSLPGRGPVDAVLALALIHHLAISNNVPLDRVSAFFSGICCHLIIEFVPKHDSQVGRLLRTREDIFSEYTEENFREAFSRHFEIQSGEKIEGSERTLYLMKRRD